MPSQLSGARRFDGLDSPPHFEGQDMAPDDRGNLLEALAKYAYAYKIGGFTLSSGKVSDEYLDCKMALSHAEAVVSLGKLFLSHIDARAVAVGGLTMGSDPIAISTASASAFTKHPVRWFSVRKDAKEHGKKKLVEGDVSRGDNVVVVDDVVTTGGSTIQAINKCREHGLNVIQVLVLVDREDDGGIAKIREAAGPDVPVTAMFTKSQVRRKWDSRQSNLREIA
jgi:orotate phosphoribosyltransferase